MRPLLQRSLPASMPVPLIAASLLSPPRPAPNPSVARRYVDDGTLMLRESCVVALDAADYWSSASEGIAAGGAGGEAAAPAAAAAAGSA